MKSLIIKKDFIDTSTLNKINDNVLSQLEIFLASGEKLGGQIYGHLNATIGNHAKTILEAIKHKGLLELIAREYDFDLNDYTITCGCNINLPGSKKQHIHRDTNFNDSKIIINIPLVPVNEKNGRSFQELINILYLSSIFFLRKVNFLQKELILI